MNHPEIGLYFGRRKKLAARRKVGAQRAAPLPAPLRLLRCAPTAPPLWPLVGCTNQASACADAWREVSEQADLNRAASGA